MNLVDFLLHTDKKLLELVATYGSWVYGILFAIVFAETGFVVTPFLPGDSLLFAVGALCAQPGSGLTWPIAGGLLFAAAFTGNAVNYTIGRFVGPHVFTAHDRKTPLHRLLNEQHLKRAHQFFEQYGGKAVILGRFVPIVRTFVPFVAGAAEMRSHAFALYNLAGAAGWVFLCVGAGLLFGNVPIVREHFSLVTIGIVIVSVLPVAFEVLTRGRSKR